jgi:hypothetical protein
MELWRGGRAGWSVRAGWRELRQSSSASAGRAGEVQGGRLCEPGRGTKLLPAKLRGGRWRVGCERVLRVGPMLTGPENAGFQLALPGSSQTPAWTPYHLAVAETTCCVVGSQMPAWTPYHLAVTETT